MKKLHETFEREIDKVLCPKNILSKLIIKRFDELGIKLTNEQISKLKSQLQNLKNDSIRLEFDDNQLVKAGFKDEEQLQNSLGDLTDGLISDVENLIDDISERLSSMINELAGTLSEEMLTQFKRDSKNILKEYDEQLSEFSENLNYRWGEAFKLLELLIRISYEAGENYNKEFRQVAAKTNDYVFEVLTRSHARSCQIASEVLTLLKNGFADGAHARWRSLHEISVVAYLIISHGNELAERYLFHDVVESYKAAIIYQEHCEKLGYEPLTEKEIADMKNNYESVIERFGKNFKKDYGWASIVAAKNSPTFRDIEILAGLKHLRPYYRMACHNVHANTKGILFKLGLYPGTEILLAGPSNVGLADPGHLTAISLAQITISLLTLNPNLDRTVICGVIVKLEQEIGKVFFEVENSIKADEEEKNIYH